MKRSVKLAYLVAFVLSICLSFVHQGYANAPQASLPVGWAGITTENIAPSPYETRPGQSRDTFRTRSAFTHMNYDDAIMFPGEPGRSHLHMYFGNAVVNAFTTADTIRSQCRSASAGGTANCSAYWMPALLDAQGNPVDPGLSAHTITYYKAGYNIPDPRAIQSPPVGLKMIAGNAMATSAQDAPVSFVCNGGEASKTIPNCPQGGQLLASVTFPRCWDGQNLDSADHKSHIAYVQNPSSGCPASHPVPIPELTFRAHISVNTPGGTAGWRLASDQYDTNQPGGYSLHADWINGWNPPVMETWVEHCDRAEIDCGTDVLGDGNWLSSDHISEF